MNEVFKMKYGTLTTYANEKLNTLQILSLKSTAARSTTSFLPLFEPTTAPHPRQHADHPGPQ